MKNMPVCDIFFVRGVFFIFIILLLSENYKKKYKTVRKTGQQNGPTVNPKLPVVVVRI